MKLFTKEEFRELIDTPHAICVSLFMPTEKAGKDMSQNPIRFKNLVRRAEAWIENEKLLRPPALAELLSPAYERIDDPEFWQHQRAGLAFFLAADGFTRYYRVPVRFEELALVERQFYLKPLLRLLTGDGRFYVLALDRKHVRLWECTRHEIEEVDLGDTPVSLEDVVGHELAEQHLQWHSHSAAGARVATFHGQGGGEDDVKPEIRKFFSYLDRGVRERLAGREAPLVLAGVEPMLAIYREVSDYPQLVDAEIRQHPGSLDPDGLRERAWEAVRPTFERQQREDLERYGDLTATGRSADRLSDILPAAYDGRVEALFAAQGERRWGRYDPEERKVTMAPEPGNGNHDLLDQAAVQSLLHGARVYALERQEMPGDGAIAAIFRY